MAEKTGKYAHGVVYIFLAVINLSLFLLFAKLGTANTPFFLLSFFRFLVPFLMLLPFLYYQGLFKRLSLFGDSKSHLLRSSCVLIQQYTVFFYLLHGSLLDITVLLNLSPIFVAFLERIFFKHPIHKSVAISLAVSFIGVLCVLQPDQGIFSLLSLIGIIAALASASSQVVYGHNVRKEPAAVSLFYLFFIGSIVSFLVLLVYQGFAHESLITATRSFVFGDWTAILFLLLLSLLYSWQPGLSRTCLFTRQAGHFGPLPLLFRLLFWHL